MLPNGVWPVLLLDAITPIMIGVFRVWFMASDYFIQEAPT
jgi:hypothetical protein